jgi:signal transduction histidine kinase
MAFKNNRKHAGWFTLGYIPILLCGINDILYSQEYINSMYLLSAGVISFVLVNIVLLSRIYSDALYDIKDLSAQLVEANKNQEMIIQERTAELNAQTVELAKSNEIKNKIFSIISHDLRSPIKTLGSFLSIAVSDAELEPKIFKSHLSKIQQDTEILSQTIDNILMWSRSQINEVNTTPVKLELKKMVKDVLTLYRTPAENKSIAMKSDVQDNISIYADKEHMNLVLRNLIGNALKFTHTGGSISISAQNHENMVKICVADTGIGLSDEELDKIFSPHKHHTTYGTTNEKGTGLGLMLCKEFIEKNKGYIYLKSEKGIGTCVYMNVPAYA